MYFAFITVFIIQPRETSFSKVQLVSSDCASPQGHGQPFLSGRFLFFVTVLSLGVFAALSMSYWYCGSGRSSIQKQSSPFGDVL